MVCLPLQAACETAEECCQDVPTACGPVGNLGAKECCRPVGAACSVEDDWRECCAVVFAPGSGTTVHCKGGTCGGPGAACIPGVAATCASGVCCGFDITGRCCAAGQTCLVTGACGAT